MLFPSFGDNTESWKDEGPMLKYHLNHTSGYNDVSLENMFQVLKY